MTKPLIITIHLINKNMITFNTMYFIKIILTLIQNTSTILKSKNSITLKTIQTTKQCGKQPSTNGHEIGTSTENLTDSILEKFGMNNKRQKRQTKIDSVELKGQNINGSATGPLNIFIEHYDCDAEQITNVKYYELNKISTCKFKPLDLDMTTTEVQLLSKAQAVEIKAYAVAGTINERVEWCSQHTDYIRANRPSYYVSDAQRTKILDAYEVRNELARINLLKNTRYKPTRYNISFNYIANPQLQKKIEDMQGRIQFDLNTPMVPPYGRRVYAYTNPMWIPNASKNAQSNCMKGPRKQTG